MDGGTHLPAARIGPNAVTRVAEALQADAGAAALRDVFAVAGLGHHLDAPPAHMVPEGDVAVLHAALRSRLGEDGAARIGMAAGRLTGAYLLAHRVPRPLQGVLRCLPGRLAARVLVGAIGRNAWTFSGSGRFRAEPGNPMHVSIRDCPLCRGAMTAAPACAYFAATLETLFKALVGNRAQAREVACAACGDEACLFEIRY